LLAVFTFFEPDLHEAFPRLEPAGRLLPAEIRAPEPARLLGREPWIGERLHDLVGKLPLFGRESRGIAPAQARSDVVVHSRLRASDLIGAPVQVLHLFQQRFELPLFDRRHQQEVSARREPLSKPCGSRWPADLRSGRHPAMRLTTSYFVTEVRCPGVSAAGIAFKAASPRS
jgi:hypothetical protein